MRILIIKTSALGDIVQCYPILDYLRETLNGFTIDWVVEKRAAPLISAHPSVDQAIIIDTRAWKAAPFSKKSWIEIRELKRKLNSQPYDVVFDLQGNLKSSLILAMTKAKVKVGFEKPAEFPNRFFTTKRVQPPPKKNIREDYLFLVQSFFDNFTFPKKRGDLLLLNEEEKRKLEKILSSFSSRRCTLIAPSSIWRNKEASDEKIFSLLRNSSSFFLFIAANEREKKRALTLMQPFKERALLLENLSFPLLQHLMAHVDRVIAMDSFPLHLAGTTPTSTFGFFGPTSALKYAPLGENSLYFQGSCPFHEVFEKRCPRLRSCKTGNCLKD